MVFRTYDVPVLQKPAKDTGTTIEAYEAEEAVLQGQLVKPGSTDGETIEPSDTDGEKVVGVALYDGGVGELVDVARETPAARLTSGTGTISAGDPITSYGGTGEEGEVDTATAEGEFIVGMAIDDDEGTNGDVRVDFDLQPGSEFGGA